MIKNIKGGGFVLDFRIETFLCVCRHMNFTYAADELHITQPAVSQHIRFLENYYSAKLFERDGKKIKLTPAGETLLKAMTAIRNDESAIKENIKSSAAQKKVLRLGVTLTIGEYVIAKPLAEFIKRHHDTDVVVKFANTAQLSSYITVGELDIALVEGNFDKSVFDTCVFKTEKFIPVCSSNHQFGNQVHSLADLLSERIIVREKGSGTRDILEKSLELRNISIADFSGCVQADNIHLIVNLVKSDCGISFLYKAAVTDEINNETLKEIKLNDFNIEHNFTFLWNRGSVFSHEYHEICEELKNAY